MAGVKNLLGLDAEDRVAEAAEDFPLPRRAQQPDLRVAAVGVIEAAARDVVERQEHRDEHAGVVALAQRAVGLGQHLGGIAAALAGVLQQRAADRHEQRRRNALAGHVRDQQGHAVVGQREEIVEIAADFARFKIGAVQFVFAARQTGRIGAGQH